jgi:large subunit ribosomal protein L37
VRGKSNLMVYSNRPLKPFGDEELIDASTQHQLPDLYPLLPTIDLKKQHLWRSENITG